MESIRLKTHIGSDGMLKLETPVGVADVDAEVIIVFAVQPTPIEEDWQSFINATYGSLADDPIERPADLPFTPREDLE